jgi:hypothetical protein
MINDINDERLHLDQLRQLIAADNLQWGQHHVRAPSLSDISDRGVASPDGNASGLQDRAVPTQCHRRWYC